MGRDARSEEIQAQSQNRLLSLTRNGAGEIVGGSCAVIHDDDKYDIERLSEKGKRDEKPRSVTHETLVGVTEEPEGLVAIKVASIPYGVQRTWWTETLEETNHFEIHAEVDFEIEGLVTKQA